MGFTSCAFYAVFVLCFAAWYGCPQKYRWGVLCFFNVLFYASWGLNALPVFVLTCLMVWRGALRISAETPECAKRTLGCTLAAAAGLLVLMKYAPFMKASGGAGRFLLPAGISFYTLQLMGYLIDVYRKKIVPERHFGRFFCFAGFFPVTVSGPILRAETVLPVVNAGSLTFDAERAGYGARQIVLGLFKKVVLADALAVYADKIFGSVHSYRGLSLIAAAVLFAVQLYCDFSGYSDIACGTGRLLGFEMPENFTAPYFSSSLRSFWKKWHISLTSWFRDYVYIPLGGNRKGGFRRDVNMLAVFLLSGVWHGTGLNYLVWGAMHGFGRLAEEHLFPKRKGSGNALCKVCGFIAVNVFVCAAWVFFRAETFGDAVYVFKNFAAGIGSPMNYIYTGYVDLGISVKTAALLALGLAVLAVTDLVRLKTDPVEACGKLPAAVKWPLYLGFVLLAVVLWASLASSNTSFIYAGF